MDASACRKLGSFFGLNKVENEAKRGKRIPTPSSVTPRKLQKNAGNTGSPAFGKTKLAARLVWFWSFGAFLTVTWRVTFAIGSWLGSLAMSLKTVAQRYTDGRENP